MSVSPPDVPTVDRTSVPIERALNGLLDVLSARSGNRVSTSDLLDAMHGAANAARAVTAARFREPLDVDDKAPGDTFDPVTDADRDAETAIRDALAVRFPTIAFRGEESAASPTPGDATPSGPSWVVDPIDGTRAFITGIPVWGTLIALNDGHEVVLGLLDQPILGDRYVGTPTEATLHRGGSVQRLKTRGGRMLAEASLCCTTPDMFNAGAERAAFDRVAALARLVRYGGDCYAFAQLAAGQVDVVVESDLKPWDIQALVPLIRGAGGVVSDWSGGRAEQGGQIVAAGSAALHAEVLARLAG